MTYRQWVLIEAWARCPSLAAHGLRLYPLSEEQSAWLAQFEDLKSGGWWQRWVRQSVIAAFLVTAETASQLAAAAPPQEEPQ